jgi:hypothetical protein
MRARRKTPEIGDADTDLAARNHADANDQRAAAAERPRAKKSADEFPTLAACPHSPTASA